MRGLAHPGPAAGSPTFAELSTFRFGGGIETYLETESERDFVDAIREADTAGAPLLVLGGGSNIVPTDESFEGVVVRDMRRNIDSIADSTCSGASITAPAGAPWDDVVSHAVEEEWMGLFMRLEDLRFWKSAKKSSVK